MKFQITAILFLVVLNGIARDASVPFIRNYKANEYKASQQNWATAQDKQGILYFGNNSGLLEFDGVSWRLIPMAGVRSILIDSNDRVYLGLENDLGYLETDYKGNNHFVSLKPKISDNYREINTVRQTLRCGECIIFQASHNTYIYQHDTVKVLPQEGNFSRSFVVNNSHYLFEEKKGMFLVDDIGTRFMEGSEIFSDKLVNVILPSGNRELLIFTHSDGIFKYSPFALHKFSRPKEFREVDDFITRNQAYCGIRLPGDEYAIGTLKAGVLVFDSQGRIKNNYSSSQGMQDNTIYSLFMDQQQHLWTAADNGISQIQYNLPFRLFTDKSGLAGTAMCLTNFKGQLIIGTSLGFYTNTQHGLFNFISGTDGQGFAAYELYGSLLLGTAPAGVFVYNGKTARLLPETHHVSILTFCPVTSHPNYVLAGSSNGILVLAYEDSKWRFKHKVKGMNFPCYAMVEAKNGDLWISDNWEFYKVRLNNQLDSVVYQRKFTSHEGLPSNSNFVEKLNTDEVIFLTVKGIYSYLEDKDRFVPHPGFGMIKGNVMPFRQLSNGTIWFEDPVADGVSEKGILTYENGRYVDFRTPFYKFTDLTSGQSPNVFMDTDGTIWFGTNIGLMQYDPRITIPAGKPFNTLVRQVISKDSLLFNGDNRGKELNARDKSPGLTSKQNNLIFHFAAAYYEDPEKNLYSYRLIGADTAWSAWVNDHKKEYSNLPEGNYRFEVRSKNQYQVAGSIASYSFTILAPWYRTWWAYLGYLFFSAFGIYTLVHLRTRQLIQRSQSLEKVVEQRTAQIQEQKNNVEQLSRIGRDITSSLSIENIIHTVYENVNNLMDASVFTIGLHNPDKNCLEFPAAIEKNQLLHPFSVLLSDENRLAAWCFNNQLDVIINDYARDYNKYVVEMSGPITGENPESVLYLPLWNKEKAIGVISAQSFSKNAYTDYHINMLRNLATYSAIALENADAYRQLASLLDNLKTTQDSLITQTKLAALGELTAGIAHEIQNPLNFINNFSELNKELISEMKEEIAKKNFDEVNHIAKDIDENEDKIIHHGKRADAIVKGMLLHSKSSSGVKEPTDINALAEEFLRLSYHGSRAKDKSFKATLKTDFDSTIGKIDVVSQEIGRVILNLITNAFYAVTEKKKLLIDGYEPLVTMSTKKADHTIEICVTDNGIGIPQTVLNKIFQPFFTTKPAGQGTGLGLSLAYDIIVKGHGGELTVETNEGEGAIFRILLPFKN